MTYSKIFNIEYKSDPHDLYYMIHGEEKKYYEFDARSKGSIRLINSSGKDVMVATSKSKFVSDYKLEFKNVSDAYELEFSMNNDASGFRVKGSYPQASINWTWKIYPTPRPYKLVDNTRTNITIAEVEFKGLRGYEILIYHENIQNENLEEIAIGTTVMIKYIHGDNLPTSIGMREMSKDLCSIC